MYKGEETVHACAGRILFTLNPFSSSSDISGHAMI